MKLARVCAGFTGIHAASVALIAYASSYVKCHFRNRATCSHGTCISTRLSAHMLFLLVLPRRTAGSWNKFLQPVLSFLFRIVGCL